MASEDVIPYNNLTLKPLFIEPVRTGGSVDALGRRALSMRARASDSARARASLADIHARRVGARRGAPLAVRLDGNRRERDPQPPPGHGAAAHSAAPRPGRGTRTVERAEKKPRPHDEMIILSTVRMPKRRSDGVYTSVPHRNSGSSQPPGAIATVMARGEQGGGGDGRWAGCAPQRVRSARARPRGIPRGTVPAAGCARRRRVSPPQHTVR